MPVRFLVFNFVLFLASAALAENWPQFRGPTQQGVVPSGKAPTAWGEDENLRWKVALPGRGWSSPVVWGDQIWLTTAIEELASSEEIAARSEDGKSKGYALADLLTLRAICVDKSSGRIVHNVKLFETDRAVAIHSLNSYASPTPVVEQGRLYCHFGTYGNACVDTNTGEVLWRRVLPLEHYVGPGSSPVVWEDLLLLTYDGADQQYVIALDKVTGEKVWKQDRPPLRTTNPDFRKSYCTPLIVEDSQDGDLAIIPGAQWLVAYEPATGAERWRLDHGNGFSLVPRPVANQDHLYFATGFAGDEMLAVELGGSGDVTDTHLVWRSKRQTPKQPSPILAGDRLFTVSENGVGVCLDAKTGDEIWKKRLGGTYSASPLRVGDRLYFFSREGKTTIVHNQPAGPEIERTNELEGRIMATPAVVDGVMYLRTAEHLYAIE